MKRISAAFDLGWDDSRVHCFVHETKTQGPTFISLIPSRDYTAYLTINHKAIVVADYKKIPTRYVKEWKEIVYDR